MTGIPEKAWLRFFNKFLDQIGTAFPPLRGDVDGIKATVKTMPERMVVTTFMTLVNEPMRDAIEQEDYETLQAQWQTHPLLQKVDLWSHWDTTPEANKKVLLNYLQQLLKQGSSIVTTGKLVTRQTPNAGNDRGVGETPNCPRINAMKKYAEEIIPEDAKFEDKKVVLGYLIAILQKMIEDEHNYIQEGMITEIMVALNIPPAYQTMAQSYLTPYLAQLRAAADGENEVSAVASNVE